MEKFAKILYIRPDYESIKKRLLESKTQIEKAASYQHGFAFYTAARTQKLYEYHLASASINEVFARKDADQHRHHKSILIFTKYISQHPF